MAKLVIAIFFLISPLRTYAQTYKSYQADLDKLYTLLTKTPSYKDQIKGKKRRDYQKLYEQLKQDTAGMVTEYDAFLNLVRLFFPFRDNHLGFYRIPGYFLTRTQFQDSAAIRKYRTSKIFLEYPKTQINLDSLELVLKKVPKDSVEGIYHYGHYLKIGLFQTHLKGAYQGVVLSTTLPGWQKGQIAAWLYEYMPGYFRAVYAHPVWKILTLYSNEKYRDQSLINSYFYASITEAIYTKNPGESGYANIGKNTPTFQFHALTPDIQYIRIGSFSASPSALKISETFYNRIKDSLTAPHIIVDLRNNTGGGIKASEKYRKLFKTLSKKKKIYVLINNGTMSEGERFALSMKKLSNVTTFGQTTRGTIAYGSNYGKTEKLPDGKFLVYITDMKDPHHYFRYESLGIPPEIFLKRDRDWIDQVVEEIENF
ncbi:S41 family peptidase [Compostibacter hankyongensis]|uniref:Tail specific protease domain-containing protein n=1 Tax=Compostibacter hankyongensis TaxID=1007089 RepID=A0ABP8FZ97_9BACT